MRCELRLGDFRQVLDDVCDVDLFCTSPPYNIGSRCPKRLTNRKFGGYDAKSWGAIEGYFDTLPEAEYQKHQRFFLQWCAKRLKKGGIIAYNHKLRHKQGRLISPLMWFPPEVELYDEIVWDRGSTHNHCTRFVYQHSERVFILKRRGDTPFFVNDGFSDVWRIPPARHNDHNAPYPCELSSRVITLWSPPDGLVCDPYSGSGTTMVSCAMLGRSFVGAERQQNYYDMALRRFERRFGNFNLHRKELQHAS